MFSVFPSKRLSGTSPKVRLFPYILSVLSTFTGIAFHCSADSEPELFLPFGSYLEHVFLNRIYIRSGFLYYYGSNQFKSTRFSFVSQDGISDPESCWRQGYDVKALSPFDLACDISQQKTPRNAATSLRSILVPYGSYLDSCLGTISIEENNFRYLYSSCAKAGVPTVIVNYRPQDIITNKLEITTCNSKNIVNEEGRLKCQENSVYSRKILLGTYLQHCTITATYYFEESRWLTTICPDGRVSTNIPDTCFGSGRDIIYQNGSLECVESNSSAVEVHVASPYLPPGNYLLSCTKQAFYPCLGHNRKGRLVAECQNTKGVLVPASLEDGDNPCRMDQLGYVANKDGILVCDPSYEFNDEDPTVGTDLIHTFQCNE